MTKHNHNCILGLGNDIIEVARIQKSIDRQGDAFLDELFTPPERAYCQKHQNPFPHFAGRFAAKEAVAKALGTGLSAKVRWTDIEILNDAAGKPCVTLSEKLMKQFQNPTLLVSISHTTEWATAVAIWLT